LRWTTILEGPVIDRRRLLAPLAALALGVPARAAPRAYRAPRTAWGAPDLQGLWTNASYTELERPKELATLALTPEAARAWEARLAKTGGVNVPKDPLGQAQSEFPEAGSGLARVKGEIRSSLIVEPDDGRLPYRPEVKARIEALYKGHYDGPEERPQQERCLTAPNAGAPIVTAADTNLLQIVQTPSFVVIVSEKYHDARIIPLGGGPPPRDAPRSWLGEARGEWQGETLVVRTAGFRDDLIQRDDGFYLSGAAEVAERFTRTGLREIFYAFSVTDPALYTRPWRGEYVFYPAPGMMFEDACHEGNYSLPSILSAARQGNQPGPPKPASGGADTAGNRP
jgi:hypothetical protein